MPQRAKSGRVHQGSHSPGVMDVAPGLRRESGEGGQIIGADCLVEAIYRIGAGTGGDQSFERERDSSDFSDLHWSSRTVQCRLGRLECYADGVLFVSPLCPWVSYSNRCYLPPSSLGSA